MSMIVRILTENQYRLSEDHKDEIDRLDNALLAAMEANDSSAFQQDLSGLIALIQQHGQLVGMDEVLPSDVIVPAPDMTLEEAHAVLQKAETPVKE